MFNAHALGRGHFLGGEVHDNRIIAVGERRIFLRRLVRFSLVLVELLVCS